MNYNLPILIVNNIADFSWRCGEEVFFEQRGYEKDGKWYNYNEEGIYGNHHELAGQHYSFPSQLMKREYMFSALSKDKSMIIHCKVLAFEGSHKESTRKQLLGHYFIDEVLNELGRVVSNGFLTNQ